jgi:hypothetical protein
MDVSGRLHALAALPLRKLLPVPQNRSGCYGKEINLAPAGNQVLTTQPGDHTINVFLSFLDWGETWVHLVRWPLIALLYQPWVIDDKCGAVGGMRIGRGNWTTQRKPTPLPPCPPQIPHDLTWAWTWATTVGSWRTSAWAVAWRVAHHYTN